jgi:plastocyanin
MRRLSLAAAATAALLALAACSSSSSGNKGGGASSGASAGAGAGSTAAQSAPSSAPKITIKNFGYTGSLTVKAGAKVTVVNDDSVAHTLTDKKTHKFDTGSISGSGGTGTFTAPSAPGKYPFGCTFHPEMAGTLTVTS